MNFAIQWPGRKPITYITPLKSKAQIGFFSKYRQSYRSKTFFTKMSWQQIDKLFDRLTCFFLQ